MANRIRVEGFNENFLLGVPFKDGVSVDEVSAREVQAISDIGLKWELVPADCGHCAEKSEQIRRQARQLAAMEEDWDREVKGLQDTVRQVQAAGDKATEERDALLRVIQLKKEPKG